jgi:6-phosphogluconolactonase
MRVALVILLLASVVNNAFTQTVKNNKYNLVVGTYTNKDKSNGIHVYTFDEKTGKLTFRSKTLNVTNPSFLAVSKDNKNIYSVSEVGKQASISSFSFDSASGTLTPINSASAGGSGPCYVLVDDKNQYVFAANYGSGSLAAIKIDAGGVLNQKIQAIQHFGSSIHQDQKKPHVHSVVLSPDSHYLLAADLGTDKVHVYNFNPEAAEPLTPANVPFTKVKEGVGPRHLTFHPNGKYVYAVAELTAEVIAFDYKDGTLNVKQYITMLPPNFKGEVEAADIHISPDGKFLYASNRRDGNDIVIYSIAKDGKLTYAGRQSDLISTPRNFAIDPTGKYLLVANMDGNNVVVFNRNRKTGLLTYTGEQILVDKPVCLKFLSIP